MCKEALCDLVGFDNRTRGYPLLGMIGRLATQKGLDLLEEILPDLMEMPMNLIILGTGDAAIEETSWQMEQFYPDRLNLHANLTRKWRT